MRRSKVKGGNETRAPSHPDGKLIEIHGIRQARVREVGGSGRKWGFTLTVEGPFGSKVKEPGEGAGLSLKVEGRRNQAPEPSVRRRKA